jgi:hypothetical protein
MKLLTVIDIFTRQCYAPPHQGRRFARCAQTYTASRILFAATMALSSSRINFENGCGSQRLKHNTLILVRLGRTRTLRVSTTNCATNVLTVSCFSHWLKHG